jgi:peptidoglycan-associated lipoprotein
MKNSRNFALLAVGALGLMVAGCAKKSLVSAPPPPAPPSTSSDPVGSQAPALPRPAPAETAATTSPKPAYPDAATRARINELLAKIEDAYFNYNEATLRPDATKTLNADSTELRDILKDYPSYKLRIEGHADERGSAEYNMALGDRRAVSAKDYLVQIGIPSTQLNVVSYGKEKPVCEDHEESCWQKNRRIHITAGDNLN